MADNQIPILNPEGIAGSIPREQLNDALSQGYSLPTPKVQSSDLTPDQKQVNVYSPKGELGTVPIEQLEAAYRQGYTPQSFAKPEEIKAHQEMVAKSLAAINNSEEISKLHSSDKSLDAEGNVLLKTMDGQDLSLPMKEAIPLLASKQVKFADPNFAALVDASKEQFKQTGAFSTALGKAGKAIVPESVGAYLEGKTGDNVSHAAFLAHRISDAENNYPTAAAIGTGVGLVGSLFSPEVLAGAKLGKATEAAIMAGRTEATLGRTLLAKGAGSLVEGATIVSPQAAAQALIDKNPKAALETLALGAGLSAVLKGTGALIGAGTEAGVKALEEGRLATVAKEMNLDAAKFGTAAEQEGFLKGLAQKGIDKATASEKTIDTVGKIANGEELSSIASKLSAQADKVAAAALTTRLEEIGEKLSPITKEAQQTGLTQFSHELTPFIDKTSEQITKLADKEGNLSLPQMVSLAENIGKEKTEGILSTLKQEFHNEIMQQTFKAGDSALEKVDAKTSAEWSQAKYNQQISTELLKPDFGSITPSIAPTTEMKGGLGTTLIGKAFDLVTHKAAYLPGAMIGHAIGGIPGAIAGAAISGGIGKVLHKAKDALLESYVSNPKNATKLAGWLGKQSTNEALGSYLMMDSIHVLQSKLDNIGNQLRVGAIKAAAQPNGIKNLLGSSANGLSKQQQFTRLSDHLASAVSQPDNTQNSIKALSQTLEQHHLPIAQQYEEHMMNKMQYLYQILPKDPTGKQPFTKDEKWQPSPTELAHFQRQLELAQDPFHIIELVKNNTITNKDVATLSTLNPEILNLMRAEINKIAYSGKMDLPYQTKLSLSVLMGESMVASLNNIPVNQSVYGPTQNASSPVPQGMPTPKQGGKGGSNIKAENVSQMTASQRIMGK